MDQLQQRLEGLPADVVGQLVVLVQGLAERIGQHGQQVRVVWLGWGCEDVGKVGEGSIWHCP